MHRIMGAVLLAAGSFIATAARADDQEIVVTATRSPTDVDDIPAFVDIVDVDAARRKGAFSIDQVLAETPGFQVPRAGPIGQQASVFSGGFESNHTLVLFDGVRIDDPSAPESVFDAGQDTLADARRIEIVQGPMSALYGSGALGGVVNILPRRGGEGPLNARLEAAAGSFDTAMAALGADGALGRLRYAVTGEAYASDGYDIVPERIATYTGEADGAEIATVTGVFDYALSDAVSLDLLLRRRQARADFDPGFFGDIGENPEAEIAQNDVGLWRLGVAWTPAASLRVRLSGGRLATDRVVADAGVVGDEYHGERAFADAAATFAIAEWTFVAGAETESEEIDAVSFGSPVEGEQDHWGLLLVSNGAVGPLDVTMAMRRDDFDGFGGQTTWRAGASTNIGAIRTHASYGTSYRAPSLFERFVPFFGNPALEPENAWSWEVGADARVGLFGRDDGLEAQALYRSSEIEDLIGFFGWTYANVDEADIDFAEMRLAARPLSWLTATASYANTRAIDSGSGSALPRRPRHAWSAALAAERGAFEANLSWRQVGSRSDIVYDDFGAFAGVGGVEAYEIVRASASWKTSERVRLYVAADNVLDAVYEPVNGFAGAPASVMFGVRATSTP